MSALHDYCDENSRSIEILLNGCSFTAGALGVSIVCCSERQCDKIWNLVLEATEEDEEI